VETIVVIAVDYKNGEETGRLVASLGRQVGADQDFRVRCVIVNNSGELAHAEALRERFREQEWVTTLDCPDNPGYFGGLNRGLETLELGRDRYVIVSNNDVQFAPECLQTLLGRRYDERVQVVCPDVVSRDGRHQNPHIARRISGWRRFQFDVYFFHYYAACFLQVMRRFWKKPAIGPEQMTAGEIHMGVGACYVLTGEFFRHNDSLECPVFLYGEEAFLSAQVHASGGVIWFDPTLKVTHAGDATISAVPKRTAYEWARRGYPLYRGLM